MILETSVIFFPFSSKNQPSDSLHKHRAQLLERHMLLALVHEDVPELVLVHPVPLPTLHHHVVQLTDHLVLKVLEVSFVRGTFV